jgi:15-cis-phytoene desaturase
MKPGSEALRPMQHTPIRGLFLAGDYTKQPYVASMEGATISGKTAAAAILAH